MASSVRPSFLGFPVATAGRIAWRESRASAGRFLFVILAVAIGTGSLTGVRGFARSFRAMLLKDARTLMAGDLSVRVFETPTPEQQALFDDLGKRGIAKTWLTETVSMMSTKPGDPPLLVAVKAVEPGKYPFYGQVNTADNQPLPKALAGAQVAVSEDVLVRTGLALGDTVRIGSQDFRLSSVITYEPDRMAGSINTGPRVMMSRDSLQLAGLLQEGSRASQRHLFRFPRERADQLITGVRAEIKKAFPDAVIADYRESHPLITRGLESATTFLSLVSLIALVVGAMGVAMAMQAHLQQKLDSIAVMKSLGGRSNQILLIYLSQTLLLALAGGLLGMAIGLGVQAAFPLLIQKFFPVAPEVALDLRSVFEGLGLALFSTLLFTLPPLLGIRQIKPILILRRDSDEAPPPWRQRLRRAVAPGLAGLAILAGLGVMASLLIEGQVQSAGRIAAWFVGGLAASLLLLSGLSWLLLRALRLFLKAPGRRLPTVLRQGLANLYRPGNRAESVLVALGVGVMFTLTIYLLQKSLLEEIGQSAPPDMQNVFLINITGQDREQVQGFLAKHPAVMGNVIVAATAAGRIELVNDRPIASLGLVENGKRFLRARNVTWSEPVPPQTTIRRGRWWQGQPAEPQLAVQEESARLLGLAPGSTMQWNFGGRRLAARVVAIFRNESVRPGANAEFIFSPGALDQVPMLYFGGARVRPNQIAQLQKDSFARFPAITVINLADVLDRVQEVIDQVALVVRFIAGFAILGGIIILASSVAGSRLRRAREVAVLKTLGATRQQISRIFSVEFLLLGGAAGLMGTVLATAFSSVLLSRLLDSRLIFSGWVSAIAIAGSALLAVLSGWAASSGVFQKKPLEILRDE